MYLHALRLRHFRNHSEAYFEFGSGLNLICGPNAQGKTSLLEAVYYLMIGRSFRGRESKDAIEYGFPSFSLEAYFSKFNVEQTLRIFFQPSERRILYNQTLLTTPSSLIGLIQGVLMTPDDLQLIKGSPLLRRQFLDIQLSQADPLYLHHLSRYGNAMRQRNQLLKTKQRVSIESWEKMMSHSASYLVAQRLALVAELATQAEAFYQILTGEAQPLSLEYRTPILSTMQEKEMADHYLFLFKKNREREMAAGHTLLGPQKDELIIGIAGKEARYFASEGQQRSCVTALHFAQWKRLQAKSSLTPLFLIDDVGMGLDKNRKERLLQALSDLGQVFLTGTDPSLLDHFSAPKQLITL